MKMRMELAVIDQNRLDVAGIAGNGWKRLDIAGNGLMTTNG